MKLKYLLIVNNRIDEIIIIFERKTSTERILKYVDEFLKDAEWLDEFNACEHEEKHSLFEHYKYTLSDRFDTHIAIEETDLSK